MKLHLPLSLRSALLAACIVCGTSHSAGLDLTADLSYTISDTVRTEICGSDECVVGDRALYVYDVAYEWDNDHNQILNAYEIPVNVELDGQDRAYSYTANLGKEAAWIMTTDKHGAITMTDMNGISIVGSSQLNGSAPMEGVVVSANLLGTTDRYSRLDLTVRDSNSFSFSEGVAGTHGSLSYEGNVVFDNVGALNFSNNQGVLLDNADFSASNITQAVFSDNTDSIFKESAVEFREVGTLKFVENHNPIFQSSTESVTFTGCSSIVFEGNRGVDGVISKDGRGDLIFNGCGSVEFNGNIASQKRLFAEYMPTFVNCDTVSFTNNESQQGEVIARYLNFEGITGGVYINNNTATCESATLFGGGMLVTGNTVADSSAGTITATGKADAWADAFEIKDNVGTGKFISGLVGETLDLSCFNSVILDNNRIISNQGLQRIVGTVDLFNVEALSVSDNVGEASSNIGGIFSGTSFLENVASIDIKNNQLSGVKTSSSLLGALTVVDSQDVEISSNTVKAWAEGGTSNALTLNNVTSFTYSGNQFLSEVQGSSSGLVHGAVFDGIETWIASNNASVASNGTAYAGAFGAVMNIQVSGAQGFYLKNSGSITLSNNHAIGDRAAYGGAVFATSKVEIYSNDQVSVTGNYVKASAIADFSTEEARKAYLNTPTMGGYASDEDYGNGAWGGAIYLGGDSGRRLQIYNNSSFVSRGNYVTDGTTYVLQGIVMGYGNVGTSGNRTLLAAPLGKKVELYDSAYFGDDLLIGCSSSDIADFPEQYTKEMQNNGTVIFSGKYARKDLEAIKSAAGAGAVTQEELEASATFKVEDEVRLNGALQVEDGAKLVVDSIYFEDDSTLLLRNSGLVTNSTLEISEGAHVVLDGGAMNFAESENKGMYFHHISDTGVLEVKSPSTIETNCMSLVNGGTLGLTVNSENKDIACLTLKFSGNFWSGLVPSGLKIGKTVFGDSQGVGNLALKTQGNLTAGDYILITCTGNNYDIFVNNDWQKGEYVTGLHEGDSLAWLYGEIDGGKRYDLVWHIASDQVEPMREATTLTWTGDSGTWRADEGAEYWTAEVEDTNFHNGDSVIFVGAAEVTLSGAVMPADVLVNNEEGTVILSSANNGQIAGGSKLTKEGAGELQLNLANAYTGGTVLKGGSLVAGHASALGLGDVSLEGGTLELGGLVIANNIRATGEAVLNGGSAYAGQLILEGGALTGEILNLSQNADLQSGSIANDLTGQGGIVKSTEGSVTLSGQNAYTGGTQVQAGTLVAGTDTALGSGEVTLAGGTLELGDHAIANSIRVTGEATLNGGEAYAGKLTLDGGALNGDTLHLAEVAELHSGSIANNLTGIGLLKTGEGTATLTGANHFSNSVDVQQGTLVLNGTLDFDHPTPEAPEGGGIILRRPGTLEGNYSGGHLEMYGGAVQGNVTIGTYIRENSSQGGWDLVVWESGATISGTLTLHGGTLSLRAMGADSLSVGTLEIAGKSTLILEQELTAYTADTIILSAGSVSGNLADLELWGSQNLQSRTEYSLAHENGALILHVTDGAASLEWNAAQSTWGLTSNGDEWNTTATDKHYYDGDHVTFEGGNVNLVDRVAPGSVTVQGDADTTISGDGSISGAASLIKKGESALNLSTANDYSGGTRIEGGTLNVGNAAALGTGAIDLAGGVLNLGGEAVGNAINVTGEAALQNIAAYTGSLTMKAGSALIGESLDVGQAAAVTMEGATFNGDLQLMHNELRVTEGANAIQGALQDGSLTLESGSSLTLDNATLTGVRVIVQNGATLTSTGATSFNFGAADHSAVDVGSGSTWTVDTAAGQANVTLAEGATLTGSSSLSIDNGYTLTTGGATINLTSGLTLAEGGQLTLTNDQTIDTTLTLAGGSIDLTNAGLSTETLQLATGTQSTLIVDSAQLANGQTTLISVSGAITGDGALSIRGLENVRASYDLVSGQGLVVDKSSATLLWIGQESDTWGTLDAGSATWEAADGSELTDTRFFQDDHVIFENSGAVTLQGNVAPGSITVRGEGDTEFTGEGQIVGATNLLKEGEGTLILSTANDYSGGTTLQEGTLVAADAGALGSGNIDLQGGTLSLALEGHLSNSIYASGGAIEGVEALQHLILYSGSTIQLAEATRHTYALAQERNTACTWNLTPDGDKLETAKRNNDGSTATLDGAITLAGGTIKLNDGITLTVTGTSGLDNNTQTTIDLSDWGNLVYGESGQTLIIFTHGLDLGEEDINKHLATTFSTSVADYIREGATWKYVKNEEGSGGNLILTLPELKADNQIAAQLTRNQRNAYRALAAIAADGAANGPLGDIAKTIATQGDISALQATLDQVDGSALAALMGSQIDGNLARLRQLRQSMGSGQQLSEKTGLRSYITATNNETRVESDASGDGYRRSAWGATAGLEQQLTAGSLIGAAVSQERARITPSDNKRWHSDTSAIDLYTIQQMGAWESRTSIGASLHRHDTRRSLGGQTAKAANINGSGINIMQELAYTIRLDEDSALQPFAAVESSWNHISAFSEGGVGGLSLNGAAQDAWATDITLGVRYTTQAELLVGLPEASLSLQSGITASVGDTGSDLRVSYQGAPGYSYEQSAADRNRWGFTFGAGMTLPVSRWSAIYASAGATLRGDSSSFDAQAGLRFQF